MKIIRKLLAALCVLSLCACASLQDNPDVYKMGVVLPFSGKNSLYANYVKEGMELAKEEINAAYEKKLLIEYADANKESSAAIDSALDFAANGAKVLHLGFTNDFAYNLNTIASLKGVLVNYLWSYPPNSSNAVRIFLNGGQVCELMAGAVPKNEDGKKLAIMTVSDALGKSCGNYLIFLTEYPNLKIISESYKDGETNFDLFSEQIVGQGVDYVMLYGYGDASLPLLESLKNKGFKGKFICNSGFTTFEGGAESALLKSTKDIEVYIASAPIISKKFKEVFEKKYSKKVHWAAAYGYDSVMQTYVALCAANGDAALARAPILDKSFSGAAGNVSIDKTGDSKSSIKLLQRRFE